MFEEGLRLYREGRYWESHEVWEDLWRVAEGAERHLLQALIQLDAAMLHPGVQSLLDKSLAHLAHCPDTLLGIDVRTLERQMRRQPFTKPVIS